MKAVYPEFDWHNILRQAYHSDNFICNHCHTYLIRKLYMHIELTKEVIYGVVKKKKHIKVQTVGHAFRVEAKFKKKN